MAPRARKTRDEGPRARLTSYEQSRLPIPVDDGDAEVSVPLKALNEELTCPVCRNLLRKTYVIVECMHRFCHDCIKEALQKGNKQCPACRCDCNSMRNLRQDWRFDALILTLYPDLPAEGEEDINPAMDIDAIIAQSTLELQKRYNEGIKRQGQFRRNRISLDKVRKPSRMSEDDESSYDESESEEVDSLSESDEDHDNGLRAMDIDLVAPAAEPVQPRVAMLPDGIEVLDMLEQPPWSVEVTFVAHPNAFRLPIGEIIRLRSVEACTVGHLQEVLRLHYQSISDKFADISSSDFRMWPCGSGRPDILDVRETLGQTMRRLDTDGVLMLFHSLQDCVR
ncbi:uncharacterized protein EV422DRAFT_352040 [Fimicolochytrium jonesii]|uniref:uncharacterized protein n=1 Tax=Fimicolochytrium jonesii TaxID=1396493 RepID=UPI0022FF1580|nr:uncharacterized protein EV422DRAFT_352040 [Fimicolochytrium jonesii]KAI8823362.1 hypothetical protein EV422DRAFT_352040 [Fimicolochytrium jonesii]